MPEDVEMIQSERSQDNDDLKYASVSLEEGKSEKKEQELEEKNELEEAEVVSEKIDPNAPIPFRVYAVLFCCCVGALIAAISSTSLLVAFPTLMTELDCTINTMMWILLCIFLCISGTTGVIGKLGDVIGQAKLYKFGMFMVLVGSFISGFSNKKYHGHDLLGARAVVGFGASFVFTNSDAILTTTFAPYNKVGFAQGQ